jgi:hypothetical protein
MDSPTSETPMICWPWGHLLNVVNIDFFSKLFFGGATTLHCYRGWHENAPSDPALDRFKREYRYPDFRFFLCFASVLCFFFAGFGEIGLGASAVGGRTRLTITPSIR